ncbi:MAG: DNA primase [Deltaproteobacteria bacterium]|nr:DNA primase [Deltaproteobacteria bacterium]
MISDEKIQEIRERADIVEIISSYLTLKKAGANFQGLCPFHAEKTPSFNVNPARQTFHCFGCGVGGDVFGFLMRMDGLSFPEAIVELGNKVGIEVELRKATAAEEKKQRERELLYRLNEVAADFFHETLMTKGRGALSYLERRGYSRETAQKFRIGFAPPGWSDLVRHLEEKGFQAETCRKLGLTRAGKAGKGDYDFFRNRLIFPVINTHGNVVAFGGRVFDDSLPKYLNSPESEIYSKARTLYGLSQARDAIRREEECILVEGYFDLLAVAEAGVGNVAATCGTALTPEHAGMLRRYTRKVILLFDQDKAGRKAAFRGMEVLLKEGLSVAMVNLEAGEDPDSYLKKHGAEAFRSRLSEARPALAVYMDEVLQLYGKDPESRARAVELILAKLNLLGSSVERRLYLQELAEKTGLDVAFLQSGEKSGSRRKIQRLSPESSSLHSTPPKKFSAAMKDQNLLLVILAVKAEFRKEIAEEGSEKFFSDAERRNLADLFLGIDENVVNSSQAMTLLELTEEQKKIITEIFHQDLCALDEGTEKIFVDVCRKLRLEPQKKRHNELTRLIMEADKKGDKPSREAYLIEKTELENSLRN